MDNVKNPIVEKNTIYEIPFDDYNLIAVTVFDGLISIIEGHLIDQETLYADYTESIELTDDLFIDNEKVQLYNSSYITKAEYDLILSSISKELSNNS